MLVLSRKLGESIVIGGNIRVTLLRMDDGKVRLGVEAPRDIPVFRQELLPATDLEGVFPQPATETKQETLVS